MGLLTDISKANQRRKAQAAEQPPAPETVAPLPPARGSVAYWEAKIQDVVADQHAMKARQEEIENQIAAHYGEDNEALETEYARLNARYKASDKVIQEYERSKHEARKDELLARFRGEVERFTALVNELQDFEAGDWLEIERRYLEALEKRRELRGQIYAIQRDAPYHLQLQTAEHFVGDTAMKQAIEVEKERIIGTTPIVSGKPIISGEASREILSWRTNWKQV